AHTLDTTFAHYDGKLRFHFLPAHCGHHLNPIEGFWRVMKDCIGAGRCFAHLHLLYQRTRQVLMAHQERPIYSFHWQHIPPRISRWMLIVTHAPPSTQKLRKQPPKGVDFAPPNWGQ